MRSRCSPRPFCVNHLIMHENAGGREPPFVYTEEKMAADVPFWGNNNILFRLLPGLLAQYDFKYFRGLVIGTEQTCKHGWCISKLRVRPQVTNSVDTRNTCASSNSDDCSIENSGD